MVEAKDLFKKLWLKNAERFENENSRSEAFAACIIAAAITNAKDEIVAELKELQKAVRVE